MREKINLNFGLLLTIRLLTVLLFTSCDKYNSDSLRQEIINQRIEQIIVQEKERYNRTIIFNDTIIKWNAQNYLDSPNTGLMALYKYKILIKEFNKADYDDFAKQIIKQDKFKNKKTIYKGSGKHDTLIVIFSQPLISTNKKIILFKEYTADDDCWGTHIYVFRKINNGWTKDFELHQQTICI